MKLRGLLFFCAVCVPAVMITAQSDTVSISARIAADNRTVSVSQEISYTNRSEEPVNEIILLNWIAAYKNRGTDLYHRKIEDRSSDLHFAEVQELGKLQSLEISGFEMPSDLTGLLNSENIAVPLEKPLNQGETQKIRLNYQLWLPVSKFTGYGTSANSIALKYFFLVPDSFPEREPKLKTFHDAEETATSGIHWKISLQTAQNFTSTANLPQKSPFLFEGTLQQDPEILLSEKQFTSHSALVDGKTVRVDFGYILNEEERRNLEFYLPLQLKFIQDRTGLLPEQIFISEKFKRKEDFFGNDDIKFWKFRFPLFTPAENADLDYFSIISKNVVEQSISTYKEEDHWFKNGIKTYLEYQYLQKNYRNSRLMGMLPDTKIFGIKPLKLFHASRLKLTDRYGIAYQYMMTQNLDQKIAENFTELSNFNEMAISNFETGMLLNFAAENMGTQNFDAFLRNYLELNSGQTIDTGNFLDALAVASDDQSAFLKSVIERKQRINFDVKRFRRDGTDLLVEVKKNANESIPFKITGSSVNGHSESNWFSTDAGETQRFYSIPDENTAKLEINSGGMFPESNFRDNYLYTKGLFSNTKKIRFKLIKDIPNPEYNEIYINPRIDFNAYDNILIGLNFRNESLFDQKFAYSLTPYYSTGTGKITGSGGVSYSFLPPESFYRNLTLGVSGSYFHYDYGLSYSKFSGYANLNFRKPPRSTVGRSLGLSYNYYVKDLTPQMIAENEYDRYNLWSLGYGFSDSRLIHEKYFTANVQGMEDFQKVSAEAFYRYEFAQNKKIAFRLFAGYFLNNKTRNSIFDYGISRISNYSFSYGLLGQSATSGLLAQQFVLADSGFKSFIDSTVNQWITSFNVDSHVWKMFNVYADAGLYKNKGLLPKFIWDSGVKVRVIPDFLEIYLPVYSTLGFEPSFKDYAKRIRYTLVLNLSAVVNTVRRGWY